jgi:aryl-alcohol dehydrogenase-like predicted oxidoreductase
MKLTLGTVQFGLDYGISNGAGQTGINEAEKIIQMAYNNGVRTIDTAIDYGNSEEVLGHCGVNAFKVTTKLPKFPEKLKDIDIWIEKQVLGSIRRLKVDSIETLMLHRSIDCVKLTNPQVERKLDDLIADGLIKNIGVSLYEPSEIKRLINTNNISVVQVPKNVFDNRFEHDDVKNFFKDKNYKVDARSIFLQGLLLIECGALPLQFKKWRSSFEKWHKWLLENKASPLQGCLMYASTLKDIEHIVIGINQPAQFSEIIEIIKELYVNKMDQEMEDFSVLDESLINPSKWLSI